MSVPVLRNEAASINNLILGIHSNVIRKSVHLRIVRQSRHVVRLCSFKMRSRVCRHLRAQRGVGGLRNSPKLAAASERRPCSSDSQETVTVTPRINPLGIQMLSKPLHDHLFGQEEEQPTAEQVQRSRKHLEAHGLWGRKVATTPDVNFQLPALEGSNINDHFRAIAREQLAPYCPLIEALCGATLPTIPAKWSYSPGWTKYVGDICIPVSFPEEDALVLDVEVCVSEGQVPTLATAISPTCWYSWVSERLTREQDFAKARKRLTVEDFIPLETNARSGEPAWGWWRERLVVGHNVGYDRARIKEQYFMKVTWPRVMSVWCVSKVLMLMVTCGLAYVESYVHL